MATPFFFREIYTLFYENKTKKEIDIMMSIICNLVEWFNTTMAMSYGEMVFIGISRLS